MAYFEKHPPIEERIDWNFAALCSVIASSSTGKKFKPQDFKLEWGPRPKQSTKDIVEAMKFMVNSLTSGQKRSNGAGKTPSPTQSK